MAEQYQDAKKWVRSRIEALAGDAGVRVENVGWLQTSADFDHNRQTLALVVNGERRTVKIAQRDLEDRQAPVVQPRLDHVLRRVVLYER